MLRSRVVAWLRMIANTARSQIALRMTTTRACEASASSSSNDELSLTQIRVEKQVRRRELFEETDDGAVKVKQGEDTGALPWLRAAVLHCRGNVCFRACVAREPETPLTELHLMQPVLGLLLMFAVVMLLVTTAVAVYNRLGSATLPGTAERALAILCAALAAAASAGLLYVGLIARAVPSHEACRRTTVCPLYAIEPKPNST